MSGGPIFPLSIIPEQSDELFASVHFDVAGVDFYLEGLGVAAGGPTADRDIFMVFQLPPTLPSGTPKIVLAEVADASVGASSYQVNARRKAHGSPMDEDAYSDIGLIGVEYAAGEEHAVQVAKADISSLSLQANDILSVNFSPQSSGWTLAVVPTFWVYLIWE